MRTNKEVGGRWVLARQSVVTPTHDFGEARRLADDIVLLHRGRIVESGPAKGFFEVPTTDAVRKLIAGEIAGLAQMDKSIIVASTTSTQDSELFDYLLSLVNERTGITIKAGIDIDQAKDRSNGQGMGAAEHRFVDLLQP